MTMTTTKKILIFEGIDQSGKSTLRKEFLKMFPGQVTIDRLFISNLVYDDFYKRDMTDRLFLLKVINRLADISVIVYVYCDYLTYLKRCAKDKHKMLSKVDYDLQTRLFKSFIKNMKVQSITINSSKDKPKDLAIKLIKELKKYE